MLDRRESFYLGNLGPIPLYVHWSFIFLLFMVFQYSNGGGSAGSQAMHLLVYLVVLVSGILLHEMGHGLAARTQGALGVTITLWAFGGLCSSTRDSLPRREIIILVAGPLVSFILALIGYILIKYLAQAHPDWLIDRNFQATMVGEFLFLLYRVNLVLGIFNIMPIYPLDGGQIVFNTMRLFTRDAIAAKVSLAIAMATAGGYFAYDMYQRNGQPSMYLGLLLFYLLFNAFRSLR